MKNKNTQILLNEGEGYTVEFKQSLDKSIAKEIVAFANSSGGTIFLGVDDSGKIKGVKNANHIKAAITDLAQKCDPPISVNVFQSQIEGILVVEVPQGGNKPYQCKEGFFLRTGSLSQKMKRDDIIRYITTESLTRFDDTFYQDFDFKKEFSLTLFKDFLNLARIESEQKDYKDLLINLDLGSKKGNRFILNNAAVLMFAKNPNKFIRNNFITCVLYQGEDKSKVLDRVDLQKDLLSNYRETILFLEKSLKTEYVIKDAGPRQEVLEIPLEALREAVLNAIIHRDYYDQRVGMFIEIFQDRVDIVNKGSLLFDKKYLGKISLPRNPLLFDLFYRLNLIEKIGSGIGRIKQVSKKAGVEVSLDVGEFFIVSFLRKSGSGTTQKTTQKTTQETTQKIMAILTQNPKISRRELAAQIGLSEEGVKYQLNKLKREGVLKRVGPDKGGVWELKQVA